MATIRNGRISTTFKYAKISDVPELSLLSLDREYSDGSYQTTVSGSSAATGAEERRKISRAEGCFITKQPGFHLEKAHWVNAVRKNALLKYEVETFLKGLRIVRKRFLLDEPSNLTHLDRNLHYTLDKLGFFAVTCSKATLQSLIFLVEQENLVWEQRIRQGRFYERDFDFNQLPFTDAMYELVLLHPHHFLQKGSALMVFTEDGDNLSGKMYVVSPDGALREGREDNKPRLPAFMSYRARTSEDILNPFLVVINAEIAFRRFKRRPHPPLCAEYMELIDLTIELVEKIYFKPIVDQILVDLQQLRVAIRTTLGGDGDVEMGTVDDLGTGKPGDKDKDKTITNATRGKGSRTRTVVMEPGPDASHDEVIEYRQYLMSGCDYSDDETEEDEDDGDDGVIHPSVVTSPIGVFEKVGQWQVKVQ